MGLGATGLSIARYLRRQGARRVFHRQPRGAARSRGTRVLVARCRRGIGCHRSCPKTSERVVVSPGISGQRPAVAAAAREAGLEVVVRHRTFRGEMPKRRSSESPDRTARARSQRCCSTTCARQDGHKCSRAAISVLPALDLLDEEKPEGYVLELSSFQLQRTGQSAGEHRRVAERDARSSRLACATRTSTGRPSTACFARPRPPSSIALTPNRPSTRSTWIRSSASASTRPRDGHWNPSRRRPDFSGTGRESAPVGQGTGVIRHSQPGQCAGGTGHRVSYASSSWQSMLQVLCEFPGLPHRMQFVRRVSAV